MSGRRNTEAGQPASRTQHRPSHPRSPLCRTQAACRIRLGLQQVRHDRVQIEELASGAFIQRQDNLVLVGQSGVGKSYLIQAIAEAACVLGYSVRYTTSAALLTDLTKSLADQTLPRRVRYYARFDLLAIDEFGFEKIERTESPQAANLLYKIIDARSRQRSTALVTNIDFDAWGDYLGDPPLAMAFLDRVVDGAIILKINGKSYRAHRGSAQNQLASQSQTLSQSVHPAPWSNQASQGVADATHPATRRQDNPGRESGKVPNRDQHVDELPVRRAQYLRAEVATRETAGQGRDRLPGVLCAGVRVVVETDDGRAFFLHRVQPLAVGMELEMPWSIARRQRHRVVGGQRALGRIQAPHRDCVQAQVDVQHVLAGRVGLDLVRVGAVVAAEREASRWRVGRPGRADLARVHFHVRRLPQLPVFQDGKNRNRAAEVVRHKEKLAGRVETRPGAAGCNRVGAA